MSLPRWDLSILYNGADDPRLAADLADLEARAGQFHASHKGRLAETLGQALRDLAALEERTGKLFGYLFMAVSVSLDNEQLKNAKADAERRWAAADGEYLTFFSHELVALPEADIERWAAQDEFVKKHLPMLRQMRRFGPHLLPEIVEGALAKRSPFGAGAWADFYDELEADLRFSFRGEEKQLSEMLELMSHSPDAAARAEALSALNGGLGGHFLKYSSQTLNMIVGKKAVEMKERGYRHPLQDRNMTNRIPDDVVEALHDAVAAYASPIMRDWYRLKATLLGLPRLAWSDRNAPLPFAAKEKVEYASALERVVGAYASFSPTLAGLVSGVAEAGHIDVPTAKNKQSGAYNFSLTLPGGTPATFVLLNYQGSPHDVMTLAHELGHAAHGLLAGQAQGVLQQQAPIAYAETASVFGEMTTFNAFAKELRAKGDARELLALLAGKIDDICNTAVRQIAFSLFERGVHGAGKRLSPDELCALWKSTTATLYGEDGDVFDYRDMDRLWSYVSHFHRPFYVYGYAFGELLTQSLYAARPGLGDRFEPLYLDLLRAGSTKDASELLAPFGLNPADPQFWKAGIEVSLGKMLEEAKALAASEGLA